MTFFSFRNVMWYYSENAHDYVKNWILYYLDRTSNIIFFFGSTNESLHSKWVYKQFSCIFLAIWVLMQMAALYFNHYDHSSTSPYLWIFFITMHVYLCITTNRKNSSKEMVEKKKFSNHSHHQFFNFQIIQPDNLCIATQIKDNWSPNDHKNKVRRG